MTNNHVFRRLNGIKTVLDGVHQAGDALSAASKGYERQSFIDNFLKEVLPPIYRFGTGDATDANGRRSGQLDVVIEYPIAPSLPSVGAQNATRLYLAEAIAAVVEVKSDAARQWTEAVQTARELAQLSRTFGPAMIMGGFDPSPNVPLFVAGYTGWTQMETVKTKLAETPTVAGILVIREGLFASQMQFGGITATGPWALWGLISVLHFITNSLQAASTNPEAYAR